MPVGWQWTQAYTDLLRGDVKAVGSSLVCLPEVDAGAAGGEQGGLNLDGCCCCRLSRLLGGTL